jgi:hypothetical protein
MYFSVSSDQIKKNEVGGAYSTYGGEGTFIQGFDGKVKGKVPL